MDNAPIKISAIFPELTSSQCQTCALLIQGLSNKEIGRQMGISHRTVEDHRLDIYRRTGLTGVIALAYRAFGQPQVTP